MSQRAGRYIKEVFGVQGDPDLWEDRRKRLALRKYGGLKSDIEAELNQDETDDCPSPSTKGFFAKTVWDQVKLGRITPFGSRTKDPSKAESSYDISHSINDSIDTGGNFNIQLHDINPLPIERHYQRTKFARVVSRTRRTIDETDDFRPYFTYWITATQFIIMVISICLYGIGNFDVTLYERVGLVLTESLTLDQVNVAEPGNIWFGPRPADLIHLGATFSPCMRVDESIMEEIAKDRKNEKANSGCCIRNDNSGCVQTTRDACSTLLSTFHSWTDGEGPEGRIYGPVCGQDPRFCVSPSSTAAHIWPDDISRWPICHKASRTDIGHPPHMTCELIGRPCCVGIHGKCEIRTEEYCRWVRGTFHLEANLCSQVSCLQDVCGMLPFIKSNKPDQIYRVMSSLFIHAGIIHFLITLCVHLYSMRDLEKMCGPTRMAVIYFGSGIVGNLASAMFVPFRAESGPSPSLFGLLACHIVEIMQAWSYLRRPGLALLKFSVITFLLIVIGFAPWIDNYGHIFGFISGFFLSLAFLPYTAFKLNLHRRVASVVSGVVVYILMLVVLLVVFYVIPFFDCELCRYLSCIPLTSDFCSVQNINLKKDKGIIL
ncbi:inactive rhomboid protein 1 [Lepeophtheirus salmonis]|uniref:Peptidase S54 rhomboid domain-containing protein n=1 Tax=Lepeophtheirus salmonis TaxID=72036 RepID=A0A0K2TK55_LEPSM|nr:inactive rhomboid protein 1-like [Lepeophtheirus salmonis]